MPKLISDSLATAYEELLLTAEGVKIKPIPHFEASLIRAVEQVHLAKEYNPAAPGVLPKAPEKTVQISPPQEPATPVVFVQPEDKGAEFAIYAAVWGSMLMAVLSALWYLSM